MCFFFTFLGLSLPSSHVFWLCRPGRETTSGGYSVLVGPKCVQKKDVNSHLCQRAFFCVCVLAFEAQRRAVNFTCMCVFGLLSVLYSWGQPNFPLPCAFTRFICTDQLPFIYSILSYLFTGKKNVTEKNYKY